MCWCGKLTGVGFCGEGICTDAGMMEWQNAPGLAEACKWDGCRLRAGHPGKHIAPRLPMFEEAAPEAVNHPPHYGGDTVYEVIKVIEAWGLGFNLGNAVKYIGRAGKKGPALEDLKKARWYLDREIAQAEARG